MTTATVEVSQKPFFSAGGTDISAQIRGDAEAILERLFDEIDTTASGTGAHLNIVGLPTNECTIPIFMTQAIEDLLYANAGSNSVAFIYRRSTDARGANNAEYTWTGGFKNLPAGGGQVGEPWIADLTFTFATDVARSVTP